MIRTNCDINVPDAALKCNYTKNICKNWHHCSLFVKGENSNKVQLFPLCSSYWEFADSRLHWSEECPIPGGRMSPTLRQWSGVLGQTCYCYCPVTGGRWRLTGPWWRGVSFWINIVNGVVSALKRETGWLKLFAWTQHYPPSHSHLYNASLEGGGNEINSIKSNWGELADA